MAKSDQTGTNRCACANRNVIEITFFLFSGSYSQSLQLVLCRIPVRLSHFALFHAVTADSMSEHVKDEESVHYEGFVMTTSSGVLSAGGGGTDLCMAVADRLAVLDMRQAEATNVKDEQSEQKQEGNDNNLF